jgi:CBS domain-containing protein
MKKGNLAGLVSLKDILRGIVPSYIQTTKLSTFAWEGMLTDMVKKAAGKKVSEIMSKKVITISEDATLMQCADFIVKNNYQRLPVVNNKNQLVGMLYIRDLYHTIVESLLNES